MAEQVILLHGLSRDPSIMQRLADALAREGYEIRNIGYPSMEYPIERLTEQVYQKVSRCFSSAMQPVHCVGHSMGAIIIRLMLQRYQPPHLGRVVQLAPPNHGTPLVDFLKHFRLFQKVYGPAALQLGTDDRSISHCLKPVDYELGVVAGNRAYWEDLAFAWTVVPRPNDGKIPIENTKVPGMQDHIVLPTSHPSMPNNKQAISQTLYFLKHGQFKR